MNLQHVENVVVQHRLMLDSDIHAEVQDIFLGTMKFVQSEARAASQPLYFMPFDKIVAMACETVIHVNKSQNHRGLHTHQVEQLMDLIVAFTNDILQK